MQENSVSLSHSEWVEFVQMDAQQPQAEGEIRTFLKGLSPHSSDQWVPLPEIIENYQHLFGAKGPLHIEKSLMEAFPIRDFMESGLIRYYPRMYRGLPRLYQRKMPSQSHIKKNFTHLPSLKKLAVSKALFSLYGKVAIRGKVAIFTWAIEEGWEGCSAAMEAMRILGSRFPELELRWVALVPRRGASGRSYPEGSVVIPYNGECPFAAITPEALALLGSSDLILQMPTFYPHTGEILDALRGINRAPRMECLGQYGCLESSWFHPKSGAYAMGLHFLEKGILIRKPSPSSWEEVKNERILQWRRPDHRFYLAYLTTPIGGAIYLHALLKSLEGDEQGIDLCCPDLNWLIQFVEKQQRMSRPILEWDLGVGTIEIYFEDRVHLISIADRGKKVRILCPGSIAQGDFRALLALSGEWVAVRGDSSFSEGVSQGKAFFYDGRESACYFMKDLVALAENRIGSFPGTLACIRGMSRGFQYNISVQEGEWVDETFFQDCEEWTAIALSIGLALQDPETVAGYSKLNRIITEEFAVNPFLCHLVQRALCHRQNPHLEQVEADGLALFTSNAQTFAQWIESQKIHSQL